MILRASGTALAAGLREGRWTSAELVEAHIAQIERVNPSLNAVVSDRFETAREEAAQADAQPSDAPFHGVPCSIKECFALTGMPNCSGLWRRRERIADTDATAVARYRAAGAIPLGGHAEGVWPATGRGAHTNKNNNNIIYFQGCASSTDPFLCGSQGGVPGGPGRSLLWQDGAERDPKWGLNTMIVCVGWGGGQN